MRKPLPSRVREREGRAETSRTPGRLTRARARRARAECSCATAYAPRDATQGQGSEVAGARCRVGQSDEGPRPVSGIRVRSTGRGGRCTRDGSGRYTRTGRSGARGRYGAAPSRARERLRTETGERGGAGGLGARTREALKPPRPPGRAVGNRGHLKSHLKAAHTSLQLRACRSLQGKESRAKKSKSRDSLTYALGSSRAKIRSVRS